jgi:hypothetical protein
MPLPLRIHDEELSFCRLAPDATVPASLLARPFVAFLRTKDEATLICPTVMVPQDVKTEYGYIALEMIGQYDFALTGILTQVIAPLEAVGISILALSTFNTDYVLIKADKREAAIKALQMAGHTIRD